MHKSKAQLPTTMQTNDTTMRTEYGWGGMVVAYNDLPAGFDVRPLLEGLPNDACHCPHWGVVLKGAIHMVFTDGSEEVVRAGEVFFWPEGHTGWCEEDTTLIDFSPEKEFGEVMAHIAAKTGNAS